MKFKIGFCICLLTLVSSSCGEKMIRTYTSNSSWDQQTQPTVSDSSAKCAVVFENDKNNIVLKVSYTSSYQTANELRYVDAGVEANGVELKPNSEKYTADDDNYKLIVGYRNSMALQKNGPWLQLGTKLKIDTVTNPYLHFRVNVVKKFSVKGQFPPEIKLHLFTETAFGKMDTSVLMHYDEHKDTQVPFRFH